MPSKAGFWLVDFSKSVHRYRKPYINQKGNYENIEVNDDGGGHDNRAGHR